MTRVSRNHRSLIILFVGTLLIGGFFSPVYAATPSPSPKSATPEPSISDVKDPLNDRLKIIETLKEKIATKVAEIRQRDKTALSGSIQKVTGETLVLSPGDRTVTISEDTVVYRMENGKRIEGTTKLLTTGTTITIFGYQSDDHTTVTAKYCVVETPRTVRIGKISEIDRPNYSFVLVSNQTKTTIDFESSTRAFSFNPNKHSFDKLGFSKLNPGDELILYGVPNEKDEARVTASRIYVISHPDASVVSASPTDTPSPSKSSKPSPTIQP
jgi:hypothetical protein